MHLDGKKVGVEFKRADAPTMTRSMQTALRDLDLDELWVVYPGQRCYPLDEKIAVRPLRDCVATEPRNRLPLVAQLPTCATKAFFYWRNSLTCAIKAFNNAKANATGRIR